MGCNLKRCLPDRPTGADLSGAGARELENQRKIKEAEYPGARARDRIEREPGRDDGDADEYHDGGDQTLSHLFSI